MIIMRDVLDVIKNVETIYSTNSSLSTLKDFERVLDELDLYVYDNWIDGELVEGPITKRHWVKASFMWPANKMPDPMGGKRLLDYGCKIQYEKTNLIEPRKIKKPEDYRPGTKKGKLDKKPIWVVHITIPRELVGEIYDGYMASMKKDMGIGKNTNRVDGSPSQMADQTAVATGAMPSSDMTGGMVNAPA
jgi:hypothetical protein